MLDLLKIEPEIEDLPHAKELVVPSDTQSVPIEFRDVSFSYTPERLILDRVSFKIPGDFLFEYSVLRLVHSVNQYTFTVSTLAGKMYALVGPTGSGKSTVMRLLFRFYDITSGCIFINGQNLREVSRFP